MLHLYLLALDDIYLQRPLVRNTVVVRRLTIDCQAHSNGGPMKQCSLAAIGKSLSAWIVCLYSNDSYIYIHVYVHLSHKTLTLSDAPRARFRTARSRALTTHRNEDNNTDTGRDAETKSHKDAHRLSKM